MKSLKEYISESLVEEGFRSRMMRKMVGFTTVPMPSNIKNWIKSNTDGSIIDSCTVYEKDGKYVVDVAGDVILTNSRLNVFPTDSFRFGVIDGIFDCSVCEKVKSLDGFVDKAARISTPRSLDNDADVKMINRMMDHFDDYKFYD